MTLSPIDVDLVRSLRHVRPVSPCLETRVLCIRERIIDPVRPSQAPPQVVPSLRRVLSNSGDGLVVSPSCLNVARPIVRVSPYNPAMRPRAQFVVGATNTDVPLYSRDLIMSDPYGREMIFRGGAYVSKPYIEVHIRPPNPFRSWNPNRPTCRRG